MQSVIPAKADEVVMLNDFGANVSALTNGEVEIEVLPAGAVVGVQETLEAVDKGLVEEGTTAWVILGALAAITGTTVKYMGARATTKAAELIGPEKK